MCPGWRSETTVFLLWVGSYLKRSLGRLTGYARDVLLMPSNKRLLPSAAQRMSAIGAVRGRGRNAGR